jgi:hypothetical protein
MVSFRKVMATAVAVAFAGALLAVETSTVQAAGFRFHGGGFGGFRGGGFGGFPGGGWGGCGGWGGWGGWGGCNWGGPLAAGLVGGLALGAIGSNGYYNSGYGSGYGGCYRAFVPVGHRGYYRRVVICN